MVIILLFKRLTYRRLNIGDFDLEDKERPRQLKKFENEKLETLLNNMHAKHYNNWGMY